MNLLGSGSSVWGGYIIGSPGPAQAQAQASPGQAKARPGQGQARRAQVQTHAQAQKVASEVPLHTIGSQMLRVIRNL